MNPVLDFLYPIGRATAGRYRYNSIPVRDVYILEQGRSNNLTIWTLQRIKLRIKLLRLDKLLGCHYRYAVFP